MIFVPFALRTEELKNIIIVNASGTDQAKPDMAVVNFGVETEEKDIKNALQNNSKAFSKITASFGLYGITEDDYVTTTFN